MRCSGITAHKMPADSHHNGDGSMMLADRWGNRGRGDLSYERVHRHVCTYMCKSQVNSGFFF